MNNSAARWCPMSNGNSTVEAASGTIPRLMKGITNLVSSAAYTRSQSNRIVVPTPTANPWTAATMGFLAPATARIKRTAGGTACPFHGFLMKVFQVVARGKGIAFAVQQDDANGGIGLSLLHGIRQRVVHLGGQSILLFGTVDGNAHHCPVTFYFYLTHGDLR